MIADTSQKFLKYLNELSSGAIVQLNCPECNIIFSKDKKSMQRKLKSGKQKLIYCSHKCSSVAKVTSQEVYCTQCNKSFYKTINQINKTKNNFCSKSCAATYNNTHKTTGNRRSKLEKWLEEKLTILYPRLEIKYNSKEEINSELDIYIPSLKLAIELNGIFHYEPIYGSEKLASIQNNDNRKFQACLEKNIELVIIDSSGLKYFKESNAQKYLDIITNIINY